MSVSGTMAMDRDLLWSGSGAIGTQRGDDIWGANWVYHRDGLQNDILVIAEEYKNLSTSGAYATDSEVYNASGTILVTAGGLCYTASGAVVTDASGGAVAVADAMIYTASGAITTNGTFNTQINAGTSGDIPMGTLALPFSGLWLAADDNQMPMKIVVFYNGLVSGYPLGVTPT